ncbi:MAG: dihydrolipoamide acetyltransferase family protein, partial [Lawsonibacter sp.]
DLHVDLSGIQKDGRIMVADLAAYVESGRAPAEAGGVREERRPMNGMRKAIAQNMYHSHMTSPTVTYDISVDMSAMKDYRAQLTAGGLKVSYTDLLVKFVAKALTEFPLVNCSVDGGDIIYKRYVNMGVAVALEEGLVVPNIPDADKKGIAQISQELKELSEAARAGTLGMDRMRGGTFTITNLGMFGIERLSPRINPPEVAIRGVTAREEKLVVRGGQQVVRPFMGLSLTADHRVVDGAVAARFLQRVKSLLEQPALMLA